MANLGKSLLFYLKYPNEMERLYEAEEPKLEGLPNADQVLEKVRLVGQAAYREAVELLEACAPSIEAHFRAISSIEAVRNNVEKTWELRFRVGPRKAKDRPFEIGVSIAYARPALLPWIWCRGARRAEDEIIRIVGRGSRSASLKLGWLAGSVALEEITIAVPEGLEEPVPLEPLIARIQQAFASITAEHVKEIAAISSK